jgi:hypothetical protein
LLELACSPERLAAARSSACVRAQQFSTARMAENYLTIYRELLSLPQLDKTRSQELVSHVS